ncbi:hypothetical protein P154DRAFT_486299 [Amniculicola lignicola CBS 123094]|uniref:Mediator of RNA polymerase II transcription subunit 1 n=1 Tax=Amniculicola lignicola CBS 123094 TaxID=1392246 RepID=A0A6A5WS88_9PLEO|nr:hypothetical protein P154DRAFT_486299 [Amniculicola lignicola CBS 123094]
MATPTPSTNTPQKHLPPFSSPAPRSVPGMMNYDSPAALGLAIEGGVGMSLTMSGLGMSSLGMSASAMGRADEDERRRRLEAVIETLGQKPGRVSEEGVLALCKRMGLGVMREPRVGSPSGFELSLLVGEEAMVELPFRNGEVEIVKLELTHDRPEVKFGSSGAKILLESLRPAPGTAKINNTLERFSHNLDKLLRMDKLSAPENGGVSCYQAIFGVYTSLRKIFEHEKKMALAVLEANAPHSNYKAEREVLCKRSGRPRINAGKCLGLSLEYWMDRRHLIPQVARKVPASGKGKDKMDIDAPENEYPEDLDPEMNKMYSMTIECEASPSSMYSPIRVTDAWVSDNIEKAPDAVDSDINNILLNRPTIDWLEPPPTYLPSPSNSDHDAMNLDGAGRLPNIRFIAKFNPPLVVPLSVAVTLHQTVGLDITDIRPTTFIGLALQPNEPDPGMAGIAAEITQEIRREKTVLVRSKDGTEEQRIHATSLYVPKTEYSRTIESLPFQHPRQLIEMLPTLRQYAFTTSLIQRTFALPTQPTSPKSPSSPLSPPLTPERSTREPSIQVDVTLFYGAPPRLTLHLPHPLASNVFTPIDLADSSGLLESILKEQDEPNPPINVTIDVMANGEVVVCSQNVFGKEKDGDIEMGDAGVVGGIGAGEALSGGPKKVSRALSICGDVGVWGEWLRREAR